MTPDQAPDGVYFGLNEAAYHADPALGSTDLKMLAASPPDWWHGSTLNPNRDPDDDTPSRLFGRAVHKIVLEGDAAFRTAYGPTDFSGATKDGKAERAALDAAGLVPLKREVWDRVLTAGTAIRANPAISSAFTGGEPEVSVFWTDPETGVRLKCRQDYVKPRATTDLKSIRPDRPGPFPDACRRAIGRYGYHVQGAHYTDGRAAMLRLIADGAVHGDHDPAWLRTLSAEAAFVFVFYQAEGAPLTWGTKISPGNGVLDNGRARIAAALDAYRNFSGRFAPGEPWRDDSPLDELDIDDLPRWALA